jgi:hypothetical protein
MYVTMSKSFWRSLCNQVHFRQGFTEHIDLYEKLGCWIRHVRSPKRLDHERQFSGNTLWRNAKMSVERDEWCRKCVKLGLVCNFGSNDNMTPCDFYGWRHSLTLGCDVTVNLKRVCDESSIVLKGIGELMGGMPKIQRKIKRPKGILPSVWLGILVDSETVLSTRYGKTMVFINKNLINRDLLSTRPYQQRPLINKVDSW